MTPEMAAEFTRIFKALGFTYVTLDLEGFRSGSMNALFRGFPSHVRQSRTRDSEKSSGHTRRSGA